MRFNLPDRLKAVAEQVRGADSIADIGSDHGKLPVFALAEGYVKRAIATDVSPKSLEKAEILAEKVGVDLITRVGDGLSVIGENEVDCVVIAGMGGLEIIKILQNAPFKYDKYLLLPHNKAYELRMFLAENGYGVQRDILVKEGKFFYNLITSNIFYKSNINLFIGADNKGTELLAEYYAYRKPILDKLILISRMSDRYGAELAELEELRK